MEDFEMQGKTSDVSDPKAISRYKYDAFISYSRVDKAFAEKLAKALVRYKLPASLRLGNRHLDVFRDQEDLVGADYYRAIEDALGDTAKLIIICSPNSAQSEFVDDEVQRYLTRRGPEHVIPVLVAGLPNNEAGEERSEQRAFSPSLEQALTLPLAVEYREFDIRKNKIAETAFENSWYTLLARLLDRDRAEIEQRDRMRRRKRTQVLLGTAASIIIALTGLTIYAFAQKAEAEKQTAVSLATNARNLLVIKPVEALAESIKAVDRLNSIIPPVTEMPVEISDTLLATLQVARAGLMERDVLEAHETWVKTLAVSRDGQLLVSGSADKSIRFWDVSGNEIVNGATGHGLDSWAPRRKAGAGIAEGHKSIVNSVAISSDGTTIVSGSDDKTVRFWNRAGKSILSPIEHAGANVTAVAISPDGKVVVVGDDDGNAQIWRIEGETRTGTEPLEWHDDTIMSIEFSPDGKLIASGSDDDTVGLWGLDGRAARGMPSEPQRDNNAVASDPDSDAGDGGGDAATRGVLDPKPAVADEPFAGHEDDVNAVAFSPDGNLIVSASGDKTLQLWNLDGSPRGGPFRGHDSMVTSVAFSPDGSVIASGSEDRTVRLWTPDGVPVTLPLVGHDGPVYGVAFLPPAGKVLVSASLDSTLRFWRWQGALEVAPVRAHRDGVNAIVFSPDGKTLVSAGEEDEVGVVRMWNRRGEAQGPVFVHGVDALALAISADGKTIASAGMELENGQEKGTIRLWNTLGMRLGAKPMVHGEEVLAVAVSHDGSTIVSGGADAEGDVGTLKFWNRQGELLAGPIAHGNPQIPGAAHVVAVAFSADGQTVVTGSADGTARLWDREGNAMAISPVYSNAVFAVAIDATGGRVYFGTGDGALRVWDTGGSVVGQADWNSRGHVDVLRSVAVSVDGELIATGGEDSVVRLWDRQGNMLGEALAGHQDWVTSVAISGDGQMIVSGSDDGTLRFWSGPGEEGSRLAEGCEFLRMHSKYAKDPSIATACEDDARN